MRIALLVGSKIDLNLISRGSFLFLILRNHFDAGGNSVLVKTNYLVIQPTINISLPKDWFMAIAPEMKVK